METKDLNIYMDKTLGINRLRRVRFSLYALLKQNKHTQKTEESQQSLKLFNAPTWTLQSIVTKGTVLTLYLIKMLAKLVKTHTISILRSNSHRFSKSEHWNWSWNYLHNWIIRYLFQFWIGLQLLKLLFRLIWSWQIRSNANKNSKGQ